MHYKNGREAKEGDAVVYLDTYRKKVKVGQLWSVSPGSETCNCQVAEVVPGGVQHSSQTIGHLYHAEDALIAIEPLAMAPKG